MIRVLLPLILLHGLVQAEPLAQVGQTVPDAPLRSIDGTATRLTSARDGQASLLLFYRGGWCPYCNKHLADVATIEADLAAKGVRILAISPDKPEELAKTVEKNKLGYTLLSDSSMALANAFGLAFTVDADTVSKYKGYGIDLTRSSGETHGQLPVPAAFLVDAKGTIIWAHSNPDYRKRVSTKDLLKAADVLGTR
jgi:peroxiredoxin